MPVFSSSTTILIKETGDRPIVNNDELLQGLGLPGGMRNLENQIIILTSRDLTERVLSELPFEMEYFVKTFRNSISVYPETPVKIFAAGEYSIPRDIEFSINIWETTDSILSLNRIILSLVNKEHLAIQS